MAKKKFCQPTVEIGDEFEEISHPNGYRVVRHKQREKVDPDLVYRLAQSDCTPSEIAYSLKISHSTLTRHYGELIEAGHSDLRTKLRVKLTEDALKGDKVALKILAESILGYGSKTFVEQKVTTTSDSDLLDRLEKIDPSKLNELLIKVAVMEKTNPDGSPRALN